MDSVSEPLAGGPAYTNSDKSKDDKLRSLQKTISIDRTAGNTAVEELSVLNELGDTSNTRKGKDRKVVLLPGDAILVNPESMEDRQEEPPIAAITSPQRRNEVQQIQSLLSVNRKHLRRVDVRQENSSLAQGAEYQSYRGSINDRVYVAPKEPLPKGHKEEAIGHGHSDTRAGDNLNAHQDQESQRSNNTDQISHQAGEDHHNRLTTQDIQEHQENASHNSNSDSTFAPGCDSDSSPAREKTATRRETNPFTEDSDGEPHKNGEKRFITLATDKSEVQDLDTPHVPWSDWASFEKIRAKKVSSSRQWRRNRKESGMGEEQEKVEDDKDAYLTSHSSNRSEAMSEESFKSTAATRGQSEYSYSVNSLSSSEGPFYAPFQKHHKPMQHEITAPAAYTLPSQNAFIPSPAYEFLPTSDSKATYAILFEVRCSSRTPYDFHSQHLFEDAPYMKGIPRTVSSHLNGRKPVANIEKYISHRGLSFVIIRNYFCSVNYESMTVVKSFEEDDEQALYPMLGSNKKKRVLPPAPQDNDIYIDERRRRDVEERIVIYSEGLISKIQKIAKFSPGNLIGEINGEPCGPLVLVFPYLTIFHHREELNDMTGKGVEEDPEIQSLLQYCRSCQGNKYARADDLFAKGEISREFRSFLFQPLEPVVYHEKDVCSAYIVTTYELSDWMSLTFDCWSWSSNGTHLGRKSRKIKMYWQQSEILTITQLEVYPLRYADPATHDMLLQQGKRFWDLRFRNKIAYSGWDVPRDQKHYESRFIVDQETYRKLHPTAPTLNFSNDPISQFDKYPVEIELDQTLSDLDFVLCPHIIQGFYLKEKHWVSLHIKQVEEVKWNKEAFERLVLPPRQKEIIKALVLRTAARESDQTGVCGGKRQDLIVGKGTGLVVLLHGGPGTGKTLTAESVAELAEMPLYSVTCGDIGSEPEEVEQYLKRVLFFGKTWNCVLLLDEADVFLEERSLQDLKRNSLVSVFLRLLEYYSGVLILTTNRVGSFDEAFKSRIQLPLRFPEPDPPFRRKIWQNFFDMLETDEEDVDLEELKEHLDDLSDLNMNGREIRNSLTTARQLAQYKKKTLGWTHLNQAVKTTKEFNTYLDDVRGHNSQDWVREINLR